MNFSEKQILQYLLAQKILTHEQINGYLNMNPRPPLQNWLSHNKLLNQQQLNQVLQILQQKAQKSATQKTDTFTMPDSFVVPASEKSKTLMMENSYVSPSDPTREFSVPQQVSKQKFQQYEIMEQIGSGGMGVVYKARDILSKRIVALKLLRKTTEHDLKRFQIEGQATAQLNHPNIVEIYELGQEPTAYMAMEFIEGITLKDIITGERLKHRDIADIFRQVAEGLAYAHSKGIVHRDIKPANIIVTAKKQVKIMDFGLAKDTNIDTSLSRTGDIVGTPQYLPPEQARGEKIDFRADIYALGATFYHVLTEKPPFSGDSYMSLFYDIIHVNPTALRKINKAIPADLESICLKCLEKKPNFRYQKTRDLAQDLQNFIERKPISIHKGKLYRWNKKLFAHMSKHKFIWALILLNVITFFIYFKPTPPPIIKEMPLLFHGITPRIPEYDNNLPYLLDYYLIQLEELNGKKNAKWKEIHAELAKIYYSLRKTKPDYFEKCIDSYAESGIGSLSEAEKLVQVLICHDRFENAVKIIDKVLLEANLQGKFSLLYPYKEICMFQQNQNGVELEKIKEHPYGLWLLATKESNVQIKEKYLREALLQNPQEENFYLGLIEIYRNENCYDAVDILYPALHKINSHLIQEESFLEEKQTDEFYMLYVETHKLDLLLGENPKSWDEVYDKWNVIALNNNNTIWKRFIAHNHILKLLTCGTSGKTSEYLTQKMHEHFAAANQLIENHYLSLIYVGNFYYAQEKWTEALVHWDQAKYYFKPCSDWLLTCEKIVMTKIIADEKRDKK